MSQQGGDRTEQATPKKLRDARQKGRHFKSMEVVTAFSLLALLGTLSVCGAAMADGASRLMVDAFTGAATRHLTAATLRALLMDAMTRFGQIMLPVMGVALVGGVAFHVLQTGFLLVSQALTPKMDRINPLSGFKRIFSWRTLESLAKALIKTAVLATLAYREFMDRMDEMAALMGLPPAAAMGSIGRMLLAVALKLCVALAIIAPFDLLFQWWQFRRDLMMTKQEVRDEYKLTEGDPQIRGRIRSEQRQMAHMRMMQAMAEADVLITNPTHYAVALAYREKEHRAPKVVAKGRDLLAQRMRQRAQDLNIAVVERREVARQLYLSCDVGDEVPEELYQAVAEILAYVYRLRNRMAR